jgi:hypothetical protein
MYPPGDEKTPTLLAATSAFAFLDVLRRDAWRLHSVRLRESEMMLTESTNRNHACQETITVRQPQRTNVARVQERCMTSEPQQASCLRLAATPQDRRALAIHIKRRHPQATWLNATTCMQVTATCSLSELRRGILDVLGTRALSRQDRHIPGAKVRPIGAQSKTTKRHRPTIHGFP